MGPLATAGWSACGWAWGPRSASWDGCGFRILRMQFSPQRTCGSRGGGARPSQCREKGESGGAANPSGAQETAGNGRRPYSTDAAARTALADRRVGTAVHS
eukprot:6603437-Alexandrium_andersonii.AAC.1